METVSDHAIIKSFKFKARWGLILTPDEIEELCVFLKNNLSQSAGSSCKNWDLTLDLISNHLELIQLKEILQDIHVIEKYTDQEKAQQQRENIKKIIEFLQWLVFQEKHSTVTSIEKWFTYSIAQAKTLQALEKITQSTCESILYDSIFLDIKKPALKDLIEASVISSTLQQQAEDKKKFLKRRQWIDRLSFFLTLILALGIGITASFYIVSILPAASPLLIAAFILFTLAGAKTEGMVYGHHLKKFFRHYFETRFFETLEKSLIKKILTKQIKLKLIKKIKALNNDEKNLKILLKSETFKKRLKEKTHKAYIQLLLPQHQQAYQRLLKENQSTLRIQKTLSIAAFIVALMAGISFGTLIFSDMTSVLLFLGVSGGLFPTVFPFVLAGLLGFLYMFVMYNMLYQAIKENIFKRIKNKIIKLFYKENFSSLTWREQCKHVFMCSLKAFGVLLILSIAVLATVFTASLWLNSSFQFFHTSLRIVESVAQKIGYVFSSIAFLANVVFNIENSFKTLQNLSKITKENVNQAFKKIGETFILIKNKIKAAFYKENFSSLTLLQKISHVSVCALKALALPVVMTVALLAWITESLLFIAHIGGTGATAVLGTPVFQTPNSLVNGLLEFLAGTTSLVTESLVDLHLLFKIRQNSPSPVRLVSSENAECTVSSKNSVFKSLREKIKKIFNFFTQNNLNHENNLENKSYDKITLTLFQKQPAMLEAHQENKKDQNPPRETAPSLLDETNTPLTSPAQPYTSFITHSIN